MIIFGTTGKEKRVGSGRFFCPQCRQDAAYAHVRASRYFTLYFIPLIPMGKLGEYVECAECGNRFDVKILDVPPEKIQAALEPWSCPACGNRNPGDHQDCLACGAPRGG